MRAKPSAAGTLLVTSIAAFMSALDNLVVTFALPSIRHALNATVQQLEWTVNAYTLSYAVFLITGAALGDRFGRRRIFLLGILIFTVASAGAALSTTVDALLAFRALQGFGGAIITPLSLTLLSDAFQGEKRGIAIGAWSAVTGLAIGIGPVVGGAIVTGISWQWIFWVNVPIGLVAIPLGMRWLRESHGPHGELDLPGVALASVGLFGVVYGVIRGSDIGWSQREVIASLAIGALFLVAFAFWELRTRTPMLPLRFFRSRAFTGINVVSLLLYFGLFGSLFLLAQFLQVARGYSALGAGLRTLPWTALPMFVAPVAGIVAERIGGRLIVAAGLACQAVSLGWLALILTPHIPYTSMIPPMIVGGIGMGLVFPPIPLVVLQAVKREEEGQASGANNALRELGGVFGVAVLATIFLAYGSYASPADFTDGLIAALWVGAATLAVAVGIAFLIPSRPRHVPEVSAAVVDPPSTQPVVAAEPARLGSSRTSDIEAVSVARPVVEPDAEAFPCPVCLGQGWFSTHPPRDPRTETCPRCYGHGSVLTGSHVPAHMVKTCPDCDGRGFVDVDVPQLRPQLRPAAPSAAPKRPQADWGQLPGNEPRAGSNDPV